MDSAAPEVVEVAAPRMMLLRLPMEIRLMIWDLLFAMTRLSFGKVWLICDSDAAGEWDLAPAQNVLALRLTCKQIDDDIGKTRWLRHVLFHFESEFSMLDKLACLPAWLVSEIRHLRVRTQPITVQWGGNRPDRVGRPFGPAEERAVTYNLTSTLKFLSHLKLDRLTVLTGVEWVSGGREVAQYHLLDLLIRHSSGWKELWFMCRNSFMLRWDHPSIDRHAQPMHWQSVLSARDNTSSSSPPSVVVYRSKTPREEPGRVPTAHMHHPANWERFDQTPWNLQMVAYGRDPILCDHTEAMKEMLVVVKRGGNANYQNPPGSPFIDLDMREEARGQDWQQIRVKTANFDPAKRLPYWPDVGYTNVNEYKWVFYYPDDDFRL
ncbi:hypothetical protein QBC37DRAFT_460193 [Rhypophila decipiens]|uniref:Uncharacterized protein n=1 Tax=Rhypophila decipiens TaxID=261697 RepID=A0AAN7B2W1_9PEZI|nr:hypothetical protein QBC37DRAFT_460193 [Rhypophila decipiens]